MEMVEEEEEDDAMVRWAVNTSLWRPTDQEFQSCLALLPPSEWPSVQRFVPSQTFANSEALTQFSWWLFYNNSSSTIELSSLVGSWLFCIQVLACSVSFQCMLGICVEVWMKNILYRIVEGQTHFGMQWRGAKISLALNESNKVTLHSDINTISEHAPPQVGIYYWYRMQDNQWKIIEDQIPTKIPIEFKDKSNF